MAYVKWFKEISKGSIAEAGGKGANLGEMANIGLPVPPGFIITAQTYQAFIERTGIKNKILALLKGLDVEETNKLQKTAEQVQLLVMKTEMLEDIKEAIIDAYESLGLEEETQASKIVEGKEDFVAVRSSATAEDLPSISEDEHIFLTIEGKPHYKKMKELDWLDPEKHKIEIPAMEDNQIKWKRVSALYKHPAKDKKLYKIKTVSGREVTISPNHSLIILDEKTLQPKVVKIKDLKSKEKVPAISFLPLINSSETYLNVKDYVRGKDVIESGEKIYLANNSGNWKIQHPLPKKIEFSSDFAYFLGVYVAEGSTYQNNHVLITNSEPEIQQRIIRFLKYLNLYQNQKINKHTIRVYCKTLVRLLHSTAGKPSDTKGKGKLASVKKVPDFVFGWNKHLIGNFLRGAFDGDGGIEKSKVSYSSTSPMLIGGIVKLLEMLELDFYLKQRKAKNPKWKDYQIISIPGREALKFKEEIGFESKKKSLNLGKLIQNYFKKSYHPEFKRTFTISPELSAKIKNGYDAYLPKEEIERASCPSCQQIVNKSSYYKWKERFYCSTCHKAYYGAQIIKKKQNLYHYFNSKGQFKKNTSPWNKGNLSGKFSQKEFSKTMGGLGLNDLKDFFTGSVKWDEIKTIEEVPYNGFVYDFTVPGVENFAAGIGGIITHNSASFAGQQATFLNVKGKEDLIKAVVACWASLFTARAVYYRAKNDFPTEKVLIAVVVQKMVNSQKSGVMFSINPSTNNGEEIVIEGAFGLGEAVVSGEVNPDLYIVDKNSMEIKKTELKKQGFKLIRDLKTGGNTKVNLTASEEELPVLSPKEVIKLAELGKKIEEHYGSPQDIEWAIDGKVYIVQSRAVTTFNKAEKSKGEEVTGKILLKGETASRGIASGPVKIILDAKELDKVVKGDILVTVMTDPDMVPAMQKAAGIVTDEGGLTSHAAIVSREMGIPCIVGTEIATHILKDGQLVTLDATLGLVYEGMVEVKKTEIKHREAFSEVPLTATEIKVIMDFPEKAEEVFETYQPDGVGLVRLEFIIAEGGILPAEYIRNGKDEDYTNLLVEKLKVIAQAFKGKPVWVRNSDIRTDEYRNLAGGGEEPKETDPMIGWHGIRRGLDEPRILKAEFRAIKKLHEEGFKNVGIMLPFVIRADEVKQAKEIMREVDLEPEKIDWGVMVETPAACWEIEKICREGIKFVSFGTNDLTQLTLGIDRNNGVIAKLFDEMHPAVLGEIAKVIKVCKKYGVKTSICGQAGSRPEMAEFLVHQGVDSISANPDAVDDIRRMVARTEKRLLLEKERDN